MSLSATLDIDLSALRANYRLLKSKHAKQSCAAVVKANGYGLGMDAVSKALWEEGCRSFFVATLDEGMALRAVLPQAEIGIFNGLFAGEEKEYAQHRLMPVLNDPGQVERFTRSSIDKAILHVDTGMTRLGLGLSEIKKLDSSLLPRLTLIMSHLACADEPMQAQNAIQLANFKAALSQLPGIKASLPASSGLFLPQDFHFDLGRPGCALYGISPVEDKNPMRHVATLSAPLIRLRTLEADAQVGYEATYTGKKGARVAIAALGYADGWMRSLSNRGFAYVEGQKVPIIGRISMDMLALDITSVAEAKLGPQSRAEFINEAQPVDAIARACDTIGYEIFTRIGDRVKRVYTS